MIKILMNIIFIIKIYTSTVICEYDIQKNNFISKIFSLNQINSKMRLSCFVRRHCNKISYKSFNLFIMYNFNIMMFP
jgi:hypothetical protein